MPRLLAAVVFLTSSAAWAQDPWALINEENTRVHLEFARENDVVPDEAMPPKLGKPPFIPPRWSWDHYASFGRDQRSGLCLTFAYLGGLEVQYTIDNCEAYGLLGHPTIPCYGDAADDDPAGAFIVSGSVWDGAWRTDIDLSEQVVATCSALGYRQVGAGPADDVPDWLRDVGTTLEIYAPWAMSYTDVVEHVYWPPVHASDPGMTEGPDRIGTCPLVDRDIPGAAGHGTCDIQDLLGRAAPIPGSYWRWPFWAYPLLGLDEPREPVFFRLGSSAVWDSVAATDMYQAIVDGYVLVHCGAGHCVLVLGYEDNDGDTVPSAPDNFIIRNSWGEPGPLVQPYGWFDVGRNPTTRIVGAIETYAGCGAAPLSDWRSADADGDRISNGVDVCTYTPNDCAPPLTAPPDAVVWDYQEDGDAWPDALSVVAAGWVRSCTACDNCPGVPVADRYDADDYATPRGDGIGDLCDACPHLMYWDPSGCGALDDVPVVFTPANDGDWDIDGDGVLEGDGFWQCCDPCPYVVSASRDTDVDGDGLLDTCDPCVSPGTPNCDADWDRYPDDMSCICPVGFMFGGAVDNCPGNPNPDQIDADGDGSGDVCDLCPLGDDRIDRDADGIPNACDNCRRLANRDQHNCNEADERDQDPAWGTADHFGTGDACDAVPCVDLCMRPLTGRGGPGEDDPTFVVPSELGVRDSTSYIADTEPVDATFCAVGGQRLLGLDRPAPMPFPTAVQGCWCEPGQLEECTADVGRCRQDGLGGGRWTPISYDSRCVRTCLEPCTGPSCCTSSCEPYPTYAYKPLYSGRPSLGLAGSPYDLHGNYVPYYSEVAGAAIHTQEWNWIADFGRGPKDLLMWFKAQPTGWFGGFVLPQYGNTYTGAVSVDGMGSEDPTEGSWAIPARAGQSLVPAGRQVDFGGLIRSPAQTFADLLWTTLCRVALDCPWPPWYFFDEPGARVKGVLLSNWDASRMTFRDPIGSKPIAGEVFDLVSPSIAFAFDDTGQASRFWVFGGLDAAGRPASEMWGARRVAMLSGGEKRYTDAETTGSEPPAIPEPRGATTYFEMARIPSTSAGAPWPEARVGATLLCTGFGLVAGKACDRLCPRVDMALADTSWGFSPARDPGALILIGGEGEAGLLDDIWLFDQDQADALPSWRFAERLGGVDGGLAEAGSVQVGRILWLVGGRTRSGPSADVWRVDVQTGVAERMAVTGTSPPARASPAVTYDDRSGRILVFGGVSRTGEGLTDLWSFHTATSAWASLAAACVGPGCPAVTGRESLSYDPASGDATIVADRGGPGAAEVAWTLRDGVWQSRHEALSPDGTADCDRDGLSEVLAGARCGAGSQGFPDFGRMRCGEEALECRAPAAPGRVVAAYSMPAARAVVAREDEIYILTGASVNVYRVAAAGVLEPLRSVRLRRAAHDIALSGDHLLAADGRGLTVYRLSDGSPLSDVRTCGKSRRVFAWGSSRAIVVGLRSVMVVDLSQPSSPAVVSDLRLWPALDRLRVSAGGSCPRGGLDALDLLWDHLSPCGASGRDVAAFDGGRLFLNLLGQVYVIDFRADGGPFVSDATFVGLLREMRAEGRYLYGNTAWGRTVVLTQDEAGEWYRAGEHDVPRWVQGTADTPGHTVWWGAGRLEVARRQ